jgi:hypothetical protein
MARLLCQPCNTIQKIEALLIKLTLHCGKTSSVYCASQKKVVKSLPPGQAPARGSAAGEVEAPPQPTILPKPPGPITFRHGLLYFQSIAHGWSLRDVNRLATFVGARNQPGAS